MSAILMDEEDDCKFEGYNLRISDSCMFHLEEYNIDPLTLCDMVQNSFDCPKRKATGKAFRKTSKRICANQKGRTFNIILDMVNIGGVDYWSASHLKPI